MQSSRVWFFTMPFVTHLYFTIATILFIATKLYPQWILYCNLDWSLILEGQLWRLVTNFFLFAPTAGSSLWPLMHIGLLGHYFRSMELQYHFTHTAAFHFLLLIMTGGTMTLAFSYLFLYDPISGGGLGEFAFSGPVLIFFILTIFSTRDSDTEHTFYIPTVRRRLLPFAHWFILVIGGHWKLPLLGIVFGYLTHYTLDYITSHTHLRLPASLERFGAKLELGQPKQSWQVSQTRAGNRLGGAETERWRLTERTHTT